MVDDGEEGQNRRAGLTEAYRRVQSSLPFSMVKGSAIWLSMGNIQGVSCGEPSSSRASQAYSLLGNLVRTSDDGRKLV